MQAGSMYDRSIHVCSVVLVVRFLRKGALPALCLSKYFQGVGELLDQNQKHTQAKLKSEAGDEFRKSWAKKILLQHIR